MKREILSMNKGWRFHLGDIPAENYNVPGDKDRLYLSAKTESGRGPGRVDYDDSAWRTLDVPHDFVVEGVPTPEASCFLGSLERKNAWYRKTFKLEEGDADKRLALHFDGVCTACKVYVNSVPVMRNYTAGIGFDVDITDIARFGEDVNVVSVYVDNSDFEGWYYEGGGIYRNVWLVKSAKVYVDLWGTYIRSEPVAGDVWRSEIDTEIKNIRDEDATIQLLSQIVDPCGHVVATVSGEARVCARTVQMVRQEAHVADVKRWDLDSPNLYALKTAIYINGEAIDDYSTTFGFRTIRYTISDGFFLNDRKVAIMGYGSHQDLAGLGIAIPDSVQEYRMRQLKAMGFNMFRTAHNPHAPGLYDACDKLGLMCMDENRWFSSAAHVQDELLRMLKRDRNHPSITMWSLYNEEKIKARPAGDKIFRTLKAIARQFDPTRPAIGCDDTAVHMPDTCNGMDIIGINHYYDAERIDKSRELYPNKPVFFSEIGLTPVIKRLYVDRPHMLGAVGWGGLPYRGETSWPQLLNGNDNRSPFTTICTPTDRFYWHTAYWTDKPVVKIGGHWNHEKAGEVIPVTVYTNRQRAELFLNGVSLGAKDVDSFDCEAAWQVPFAPGELKAVACSEGKEPLVDTVRTVGAPARLGWEMENRAVTASGMDTAIITLYVLSESGEKLPLSEDYLLKFSVKRGGRVLAVGSPNRGDHNSWQKPEIRMCKAQAQVYVECDSQPGALEMEVSCDSFETLNIRIEKQPAPAVPAVPGEDTRFVPMWHISPTLIDKPWPDLDAVRKQANLAEWKYVEISRGNNDEFTGMFERFGTPPSHPTPPKESARVMYQAVSRVPRYEGEYSQLQLKFERFEGVGEVRIYGEGKCQSFHKKSIAPDCLLVDVDGFASGDEVEIWCVLEANNNYSSISKPVHWIFS